MGRGTRSLPVLEFKPLPSTYDPAWLNAFTQFETATFHGEQESGCSITPPQGAPRFVTVDVPFLDNTPDIAHVVNYYTTPKDLLTELVAKMRIRTSLHTYVLEYLPSDLNFKDVDLKGYLRFPTKPQPLRFSASAVRLGSVAAVRENRIKQALQISSTYSLTPVPDYDGTQRFLFSTHSSPTTVDLKAAFSIVAIEETLGFTAVFPTAFVDLYDLDLSAQPFPTRIGLRLTTRDGTFHSLTETS